MKFDSVGILIDIKSFGERDCLARIFTKDYGILSGMIKGGAIAKKNKPLVGQFGAVSWNARLESQLGVFHWESEKNLSVSLMINPITLSFMNSSFALLYTLLPEREKYEILWHQTINMLENLDKNANEHYLNWEINLLGALGYALDLGKCASCGKTNNLTHLSPRTARAVCGECATPYLDKLYTLPINLDITKKFLEKIIIEQGGKELPLARKLI